MPEANVLLADHTTSYLGGLDIEPMSSPRKVIDVNAVRRLQRDPGLTISGSDLQQAVDIIGWSYREFSRRARTPWTTVRRWLSGEVTVPRQIALDVLEIAICHQRTPIGQPSYTKNTTAIPLKMR